jgi:hypothetical protein
MSEYIKKKPEDQEEEKPQNAEEKKDKCRTSVFQ